MPASEVVEPGLPQWYLSFVDTNVSGMIPLDEQVPGGPSWLGCCVVEAPDFITAVAVAGLNGCNPGGEVQGWHLRPGTVLPSSLNRLARTTEEAEALGG